MKQIDAFIEVILAGIIWGFSGVFIKFLALPSTTISLIRLAVPTVLLLVWFWYQKTVLFTGPWKTMLLASGLNAVRVYLYYVGFTLTTIGNAVIMNYTWPLFAAILGYIFLKEKLTPRNSALLLLSATGIFLMYLNKPFSFADQDVIGMSVMMLASFIYAITLILFKKESQKYKNMEIVFYQNLAGAVLFLPFLFLNPLPNPVQLSVGIVYAILIGVVGFGLFFSALKKINASLASSVAYVEVPSGIALGIIFFHEALTWNMVIGGLLIVTSTILLIRQRGK